MFQKNNADNWKSSDDGKVGSVAEIQALRSGLFGGTVISPGSQARKDVDSLATSINNLFSSEKHRHFRAKVEQVALTVDMLNSPRISQPRETMQSSLLTIRKEMTQIMMASETNPDPRLANVVAGFASLERSATAFALHEQKLRRPNAQRSISHLTDGSSLFSALSATPSKNKMMIDFPKPSMR